MDPRPLVAMALLFTGCLVNVDVAMAPAQDASLEPGVARDAAFAEAGADTFVPTDLSMMPILPPAQDAGPCPPSPVREMLGAGACALPTGTTCPYVLAGDGWWACTCGCRAPDRWTCFASSGGPGCPGVAPIDGTACTPFMGMECPYYPTLRCRCTSRTDGRHWVCTHETPVSDCMSMTPAGDAGGTDRR